MNWEIPVNGEPIGYLALIEKYQITSLPHFRSSYVVTKGQRQIIKQNGHEIHVYPKGYSLKNKNDPFEHLEFAMRNEGINIEILGELFKKLNPKDIEKYIAKSPSGKYSRKIWYLYEELMNLRLDLEDGKAGTYVSILDPKKYYTSKPITIRRYRIRDNLLGPLAYCPIVRRTKTLDEYEQKNLSSVANEMVKAYDPATISRAMNYLYTKETMSSYEIERERPSKQRMARFVDLLQRSHQIEHLSKKSFIKLQNSIVDPRFAAEDYRDFQNYVGELPSPNYQLLHFICPKPEDIHQLMDNFLLSADRIMNSDIPAVISAAMISFGFVFLHPFEDGNGRIHRFLIHQILSKTQFTPRDVIFPVSAVLLKDRRKYDEMLEIFSKPLLSLITDYTLDDAGELTVHQDTVRYYKSVDFTPYAEFLFSCVEETIQNDFKLELEYIANYDEIKSDIQDLIDMPDAKIDLLIKLIMQNKGTLSNRKKEKHFSMLTDDEVEKIEAVIGRVCCSMENN